MSNVRRSSVVAAVTTGDVQSLMDVLAPDVVLVADGGRRAHAVRVPVAGIRKVVALLSGFPRVGDTAVIRTIWLNGAPAARIDSGGFGTTVVSVDVVDDRISNIFVMRNPEKLRRLEQPVTLRR